MKDIIELFDGDEIGDRLFNPELRKSLCNVFPDKALELQIMEKLPHGPNP